MFINKTKLVEIHGKSWDFTEELVFHRKKTAIFTENDTAAKSGIRLVPNYKD